MVNNPINISKTNHHLSIETIELKIPHLTSLKLKKDHIMLEIQVLDWDMNKNTTWLNG